MVDFKLASSVTFCNPSCHRLFVLPCDFWPRSWGIGGSQKGQHTLPVGHMEGLPVSEWFHVDLNCPGSEQRGRGRTVLICLACRGGIWMQPRWVFPDSDETKGQGEPDTLGSSPLLGLDWTFTGPSVSFSSFFAFRSLVGAFLGFSVWQRGSSLDPWRTSIFYYVEKNSVGYLSL